MYRRKPPKIPEKNFWICAITEVAIRFFGKKEKLGRHIGKGMRTVIAVIDRNFAQRLLEMIDDHGKEHGGV